MDRYVRVEQPKDDQTAIQENEVRIMASGKMRNYISYATTLLMEKNHKTVALKAMGRAIDKTVTIAEIIRRRIVGLHQNTQIGSVDITDVWEPLEEGLNRLETTRHVSVMTITLSMQPLDTSAPGYQAPLPEDQVKPLSLTTGDGSDGVEPPRRPRLPAGRAPGRGQGGLVAAGLPGSDELDGAVPRDASKGMTDGYPEADGAPHGGGYRREGYGRGGGRRGRGGGYRGRGGRGPAPGPPSAMR